MIKDLGLVEIRPLSCIIKTLDLHIQDLGLVNIGTHCLWQRYVLSETEECLVRG